MKYQLLHTFFQMRKDAIQSNLRTCIGKNISRMVVNRLRLIKNIADYQALILKINDAFSAKYVRKLKYLIYKPCN